MWIHVEKDNVAFNSAHVSRLFVEETGSSAALKAEINGRPFMIAYLPNKAAAQEALRSLMEQCDSGVEVARIQST